MKKFFTLKLILFAVILSLGMTSIVEAENTAERWRLTGFTKYRDGLFADLNRLTFTSSGSALIWVKIAPGPKSKYRKELFSYLMQAGKNRRQFKAVEILCELECVGHRIRFLRFAYLDRAGQTMHSADETAPLWMIIPPGNLWGNVEKVACEVRK